MVEILVENIIVILAFKLLIIMVEWHIDNEGKNHNDDTV